MENERKTDEADQAGSVRVDAVVRAAPSDRKRAYAQGIIERYTLSGCYTVDDWNVYAKACAVLGKVPFIDPCKCKIPVNQV